LAGQDGAGIYTYQASADFCWFFFKYKYE
jgi:hypothetical protein